MESTLLDVLEITAMGIVWHDQIGLFKTNLYQKILLTFEKYLNGKGGPTIQNTLKLKKNQITSDLGRVHL